MSISSINYANSLLGLSVQNLSNQLSNLSTELSTGAKSTNYAGMGVNEGFAIAARSQLANISAFSTTMTNVNTDISAANNVLQSMSSTVGDVQSEASSSPQNLTSTGQTIGQQNANSELSALIGMLNTQVGTRYLFSGTAINTPAVASADDILNGTTTQAGLKQVIAERQQADLGSNGMGRINVTAPTPVGSPLTAAMTTSTIAEDAAGSPFGLKLNSVSSTLANTSVSQIGGSPAKFTVNFTGQPNPGDTISVSFKEPDGTTDSIKLTASNANPVPSGSFAIGATPDVTANNFNSAITSAISTLANTSTVAASAVEAGDNFFDTDSSATGTSSVNNQAGNAITGATALVGASGSDSLSSGFTVPSTITVNGTTINFTNSTSGISGTGTNSISVGLGTGSTVTVGQLLSTIDGITGTTTPSSIDGGVVTINTPDASTFSVTPAGALSALGFGSGTVTAQQPPLRVDTSSSSLSGSVKLVSGSANTVQWYTGNSGPGSARSSATVRIDSSQTVQFGAQANEQAIRQALQSVATYAAVTFPPTGTNSAGASAALSQRIAANLTPAPGAQTISDIQTDFATAQTAMQNAQARQTQTQSALQNLVTSTEGIDQSTVASELLALQNSLQASYQTTSMLSQLTLTKYLPAG